MSDHPRIPDNGDPQGTIVDRTPDTQPESVQLPCRLGDYELLRVIGRGGMGTVYEARQVSLDRRVAVKILPPEAARDAERLSRFEREAHALAAIEHPNIVTIHSVESVEGRRFITMELVRGEPLSHAIPRDGMRAERLLDLAVQLADALLAAQGQGITHRDLKPANIIVSESGRAKVLDFGLARLMKESTAAGDESPTETGVLTRAHQVLGTLPYMSPEQIEGGPVDSRSDLFSLGIILYEMATGRRPFTGDTWTALMSSITRDAPPALASLRPDLPGDLDRIICRCLQKEPGRRYQTAADLRNELQDLYREVVSESVRTGRVPSARRIMAFAKAKWLIPTTAIPVLLVVAVYFYLRPAVERTQGRPTIVVMPFENLGAQEDAYFAAGLTDEITSRLAVASGLKVISRTSARQYDRTDKTVKEIGRDLGVSHVLDGTVRWERGSAGSGRVRITPQLIQVSDDTELWAQSFDRIVGDVLPVQSEIAEAVVARLGVALRPQERKVMTVRPTNNTEAYLAYLQGQYYASQPHFSEETWRRALESYEQAVRLDPAFAVAYAELSKAHARLTYLRADLSKERVALARQALQRALSVAPDAPEVHMAAGFFHFWAERDPDPALHEFDLASRQLPDSAEVLAAKAELYRLRGRWRESLELYRSALELSPRDVGVIFELALTKWCMRRYPEALDYANRAIAMAPDQPWPYLVKAFNYWSWKGSSQEARSALAFVPKEHEWYLWVWYWQEMFDGRYREAVERLESSREEWIRQKMWAAPKALFAGLAHEMLRETRMARADYQLARQLLEAELARQPDDPRYHSSLGIAYAALGRKDEAIREGRRATELLPLEADAFYALGHLQDLAVIYTAVGEDAAALKEIEHLLSIPSWVSPAWVLNDPQFARLKEDPRLTALLSRFR